MKVFISVDIEGVSGLVRWADYQCQMFRRLRAPLVALALAPLLSCTPRTAPPALPVPFLAPCPSSPNCVSSLAVDAEHHVEPLHVFGDPSHAIDDLRRIIESMPRACVVATSNTALHAEFTSRIFHFVDDVDLQLDGRVVQIRSASRTGYSDLGVNRERVEAIRHTFENQPAAGGS
jgi:uncharacterized protein (DUF1499 family)